MSRFKNDGLQVQEYVYDFSVDGGATGAISLSSKAGYASLPDNAIVKQVTMRVIEAVTGTSSTVAVGNTTDPDGYFAAIAEATLVADYVHAGGVGAGALIWDDTNDHMIPFLANSANDRDFSITVGTAALTAGKLVFFVEYLLDSLA